MLAPRGVKSFIREKKKKQTKIDKQRVFAVLKYFDYSNLLISTFTIILYYRNRE